MNVELESAPVPFEADVLRAALEPGYTQTHRVFAPDGTTTYRRTTVVESNDETVTFEFQPVSEDGELIGDPRQSEATYDELVGHATYPLASTTITETTRTVEAGTFDGWLYEVSQPDGTIAEAFFARDVPGPPVHFVEREDDAIIMEMELVAH